MDNDDQTFQTWNKVASAYQDKFMNMDLYNDSYDIFCQLIEKSNPKIFEIGCGPGNITRYISGKRPDFKIEAIDIAPEMIQLAKVNNPNADFKIMDCKEMDSLTTTFDGIICGFCMPYLTKEDCVKLIANCSSILNNAGLFYFSIIEDDYKKSGFETSSDGQHKMFVYFHQQDYLQEALEKSGFETVHLLRIKYPKSNDVIDTHLIFIAQKSKIHN